MFFKKKVNKEDVKYERILGYKVNFVSKDISNFFLKKSTNEEIYCMDMDCIKALQSNTQINIGPFKNNPIRFNHKLIIFETLPDKIQILYKLYKDLEIVFAIYFNDEEIMHLYKKGTKNDI